MANGFKGIFKIFSRSAVDSVADSEFSGGSGAGTGVSEVWLYPDSEELRAQTAVGERKVEGPIFRIGRRVSDSINYPGDDAPELLIYEESPFTLSKLQCQIEWDGKEVVLRDMGSRLGTRIGTKRLRSNFRESSSLVVPKGTHTLILGRRDGPFRFRLEVT